MVIDWYRISELLEEIGSEDFDEVVEIFLEEVESEIENLRQSQCETSLEAQLHFLKGSALNLGFSEFSKLCQVGETAAANGNQATIDLPAILSSYELSKAEFLNALIDSATG